jgi:hypothetical protein
MSALAMIRELISAGGRRSESGPREQDDWRILVKRKYLKAYSDETELAENEAISREPQLRRNSLRCTGPPLLVGRRRLTT